jgi:hypothetical protein
MPLNTNGVCCVPLNTNDVCCVPLNTNGVFCVPLNTNGVCYMPLNTNGVAHSPKVKIKTFKKFKKSLLFSVTLNSSFPKPRTQISCYSSKCPQQCLSDCSPIASCPLPLAHLIKFLPWDKAMVIQLVKSFFAFNEICLQKIPYPGCRLWNLWVLPT